MLIGGLICCVGKPPEKEMEGKEEEEPPLPAGAGEDAPLGGVQNSRLRALRLRALRVHPEDVDLLLQGAGAPGG